VIAKAAQIYTGDLGVYLSSFIAGLPDVDAVTLSMARLARPEGGLSAVVGARAIVLGAMANTLAKGAIVLSAGAPGLRRRILPSVVMMLTAGVAVAFLV